MNPPSQAAGILENPAETPGIQMILKSPMKMSTKPYIQKTLTFKPNPFCERNSHVYRNNEVTCLAASMSHWLINNAEKRSGQLWKTVTRITKTLQSPKISRPVCVIAVF